MVKSSYSYPVSQLLANPIKLLFIGDSEEPQKGPVYADLGLTEQHINELIRMATDEDLLFAESDSPEVWAPSHAIHALGQLRAEKAVEALLSLFHKLEDYDWVGEEIPRVIGQIGAGAIPELAAYLADDSHGVFPRVYAAHSLECIGNTNPEGRIHCIEALTNQLRSYVENEPTLNGFLISYLLDLKAIESVPTIQKAFQAKCVALDVTGDLEDVEIELGLRAERSTPRARQPMAHMTFSHQSQTMPQERREGLKIGRNDPCPCGSGKKYKKCCG